jgi:hypothetical protein
MKEREGLVPRGTSLRFLRPGHVGAAVMLISALVLGTQLGAWGASPTANQAQAKKHLLVLADMPTGWKTEAGSTGGGSGGVPGAKQLAGCIGVSSKLINANPPEVDSPYFENASGSLEVQDTVSTFGSAEVAKAELAALSNAKTPSCMTTLLNGSFKTKIAASAGPGATLGNITVTKAGSANFAKGAHGLHITIPVTSQGQSLTVNIAVVYAVKGTLGQEISFNSYGSPFPASISTSLTAIALKRL